MNHPSTHVVIISHGMETLTRLTLGSLQNVLSGGDHLTVIDNASPVVYPTTLGGEPTPRLLRFDRRHGYGEACNLGARTEATDLILFLHADVFPHPDALPAMWSALNHDGVGACGTRLNLPDGTLCQQELTGTGVANPGVCMMVRRDVFQSLEGFDSSYGLELTTLDFCLRAQQAGWQTTCTEEASSLYFKSLSEKGTPLLPNELARFRDVWGDAIKVQE